jgi:16S rRNA processing protein RimM
VPMASDSLRGAPVSEADTLEVGRVSKAHGILGELRVTPHWESSESLVHAEEIWLALNGNRVAYQVERVRAVPRAYLVKLRGIGDRNAAEALHGATVSVRRAVLAPLEPGEYYLVDLIGARVVGPDGPLGQVVSVVSHPTVDVIVLKLGDGRTAEQALSEPWLTSVDVAAGEIVLSSLDGLM